MIAALLLAALDPASANAEKSARKAKVITTCATGADCEAKWRRIKEWVSHNSKFQIAVDRATLISTYPAMYPSLDLAFTIVRDEPVNGVSAIRARAWCGNVIACDPKPRDALSALTRVIGEE